MTRFYGKTAYSGAFLGAKRVADRVLRYTEHVIKPKYQKVDVNQARMKLLKGFKIGRCSRNGVKWHDI